MDYNIIIKKIVTNNWKKSRIHSIKKLFRGHTFPVFDISIENPSKNIVIKIIEDKKQEKRGILEKNVIKLLLNKFPDFPVPNIIKFDNSKKIIDYPYIIEEKISGEDLADVDPSKIRNKKEFVISFARFAGQMNSISFEHSGYFDEKLKVKPTSWYDLILEELSEYVDRIEQNKYLDKVTLQKVKKYIENNKSLMRLKNKPRFIHNDYHGSNIKVNLINKQCKITGIFDFEICMSGDPIRELYKIEWYLNKLPNHKIFFYKEYSKYVKLPPNYKKRLEFYELLGRLKHVQLRNKFETSSHGKKVIKEGIKIIKNIVN